MYGGIHATLSAIMRRHKYDLIAVFILCLLSVGFFFHIFYPHLKLLITPDFGRSDAWHFSFATKFALGQSLQAGKLPLWRSDMGNGFPLFAEGQSGALFLPNLILLKLLPPLMAYNILLVGTIATLALGTYWWSRVLGLTVFSSLFASVSIAFSGLPITQLPHITLLQATSLLPLLGALTTLILKSPALWLYGLWAFVSSQQILAGFPQSVLLTQVLCGSLILWHTIQYRKWKVLIIYAMIFGLSVLASLAQILPSKEFLRYSAFPQGFDLENASQFSMPLKHLLSFLAPYPLGNPRMGTYPEFWRFDNSMFWENTTYMGLLPLLFALTAIILRKKKYSVWFFASVVAGSIILAWGKYSPLYLIFGFWPLNLFRVPSRFLWLAVFGIGILSAYGISAIQKHIKNTWIHVLFAILLIFECAQLFVAWNNYHLYAPAKSILEPPSTIVANTNSLMTIAESSIHNEVFIASGWSDPAPFLFLRNGISQNSNIYWGVRQHGVYAGRFLLRTTISNSLLDESMDITSQGATISAQTAKFMRMFGIDVVNSFVPVTAQNLEKINEIKEDKIVMAVYKNTDQISRIRVVSEATVAATVNEAQRILSDPAFEPNSMVLLETHEIENHPELGKFLNKNLSGNILPQATISSQSDVSLAISISKSTAPALLVVTDTYYPGWVARTNGQKTPIFAANVSQRAVYIPPGTDSITMHYEPSSFRTGMLISGLGYGIIIVLMAYPLLLFPVHILYKAVRHVSHHPRNRGR